MTARELVEEDGSRFKVGDLVIAVNMSMPLEDTWIRHGQIYRIAKMLGTLVGTAQLEPVPINYREIPVDTFWVTRTELLQIFRLATKAELVKAAKDVLSKSR